MDVKTTFLHGLRKGCPCSNHRALFRKSKKKNQDIQAINKVKVQFSKEFEMKDLGKAKKILGEDIFRNRQKRELLLSQEQRLEKVLQKFVMFDAKPVITSLASHFKLSLN
ncbi:hypothetical protein CR513_10088, partial [Mucuna pruriens]